MSVLMIEIPMVKFWADLRLNSRCSSYFGNHLTHSIVSYLRSNKITFFSMFYYLIEIQLKLNVDFFYNLFQ